MSEQDQGSRKRENHGKPEDFGRSVARQALDEARRRKDGKDPVEPVEFDAKIVVTPSGKWSVCCNFGLVSVCYSFE